MKVCTVEGCGRLHAARGLCQAHYKKARANEEFTDIRSKGRTGCKVGECSEGHYALGYCRKHWVRVSRNGSTAALRTIREPHSPCEVPGCQEENVGGGLCRVHYDFRKRTGYDLREEAELLNLIERARPYGLTLKKVSQL